MDFFIGRQEQRGDKGQCPVIWEAFLKMMLETDVCCVTQICCSCCCLENSFLQLQYFSLFFPVTERLISK